MLLGCAAWRMTLYVQAYGLSFKRCLTYWGMVMMALFFLTAAAKLIQPSRSFCRIAFPLALAGWLVLNCIPVDFLVAKNRWTAISMGKAPPSAFTIWPTPSPTIPSPNWSGWTPISRSPAVRESGGPPKIPSVPC